MGYSVMLPNGKHACVKDRVGRSGCDLLWVRLNPNISLDILGINTNEISKNHIYLLI